MGMIKSNKIQAGLSTTLANNFIFDASANDGSLVIKREDGTIIGSFDSSGNLTVNSGNIYTKSNILGTVSQLAGIPTGAIIERGENANGKYSKFADGTLICKHQITFDSTTFVGGSIHLSSPETWTYPMEFVDSPSTSCSDTVFTTNWYSNRTVATNTSFRAMFYTSYSGNRTVNLCAIGRWF